MYKCKHYKDFCWKFFDESILQDLDTIRECHGSSITINDWSWGGSLQQCGFRSNMDPLVKGKRSLYCSSHCMGKAFDLHSSNIKKLYKDIEALFTEGKLRAIKRIESPESTKYGWCHIDSFQTSTNKLEVFTA